MLRIYYARADVLRETGLYQKALNLLPAERCAKLKIMKTEENRIRSAAAWLLLRIGMEEAFVLPGQMQFAVDEYGKPYIKNVPNLSFNLSHSGVYAAAVVSDGKVGIDIEKPREKKEQLARRFFSGREYCLLQNAWSDSEFVRIWTRKESYIKAVGLGMRIPLSSFSVTEEEENGYYFASFPMEAGYWLSVCRKGHTVTGVPQEVCLKQYLMK